MKRIFYFLSLGIMPCMLLAQPSSLEELREPFSKYSVSTTECSTITHTSGTLILIPDHAFNVNTDTVKFVNLFYREIRNPIGMVINGYNMVTEIMNKPYYLESNGMFEIYALHDNDTVDVHEDRSLMVRFAINKGDVDPMMEAFKYDKTANHWDAYDRISNMFINNNDQDLWGSSSSDINIVEEELEYSEWRRQDSIRKVAFQAMEIFDFGLYNYDKVIRGEVFIPIIASFVDKNNSTLKDRIYVVYEDINTVFYFDKYQWEEDFFLIKDKKYNLFSLDKDGNIYKLNSYPQITDNQNQEITFILHNEGAIPNTKNKLAIQLGIK